MWGHLGLKGSVGSPWTERYLERIFDKDLSSFFFNEKKTLNEGIPILFSKKNVS